MPLTPNWTPEQREAARAAAARRAQERREAEAKAQAAEAAEIERIRKMMEAKFGEGVQFIACRRGKPPVFGRPK